MKNKISDLISLNLKHISKLAGPGGESLLWLTLLPPRRSSDSKITKE